MPTDDPWDPYLKGRLATVRLTAKEKRCAKIGLLTQIIGEFQKHISAAGAGKGVCLSLSKFWLKSQKEKQRFLDQLLLPGATIDKKLSDAVIG